MASGAAGMLGGIGALYLAACRQRTQEAENAHAVQRLDVTGFRLGDEAAVDRELWHIWQANRLGLHSEQAHVDALALGRSYPIVGTNEESPSAPLVTVECPLEVHVDLDHPRTREVRAALKRQYEEDGDGYTEAYATLYLPNETVWYSSDNGGGTWSEINRDEHGMGKVPVVPLVNRPRTRRRTAPPRLGAPSCSAFSRCPMQRARSPRT